MGLEVPPELIGLSGLYNHPDPLLRRLRIEDPSGSPILDVEKYWRDKDTLIFYAGSEGGSNNLKELHRSLTEIALKYLKSTAVVYVSTDTDPESQKRITKDVPWHRLTFNDNSDFAPVISPKDQAKITEIEDVERGEDFIQAGEIEIGAEKINFEAEEYPRDYVRPLSRAALTCLVYAYSTPHFSVYHIPSHKFVAKNVKPEAFSSKNIAQNMELWRNGTSQSISIKDVLLSMKWALIALTLALLYRLSIMLGQLDNATIPTFIHNLGWRNKL